MEGQSPSQHYQDSAEDVWEGPKEGPGFCRGQPPQPQQVQGACVIEADEHQHAYQDAETPLIWREEWPDPSIVMVSMYVNQIKFCNCL